MAWLSDPSFTRAWAGVGVLLVVGTVLSQRFHRCRPTPETKKTLLRVRTWWLIVGCLFVAMAIGPRGIAILFGLVTLGALAEFVALDRAMPRRGAVGMILAFATVVFYVLSTIPFSLTRACLIGMALLLVLGTGLLVATRSLRRAFLGISAFLLGACGLAHVVALSELDTTRTTAGMGIRLVFVLLLLTELNDIAQYLWGKNLGRRPVLSRISPGKTWAGLIGGVLTTAILAAVIIPSFTTKGWPWGLLTGLLIGVGGFVGDILASAYKRYVGAGDSGTFLPGHGGIIDRIDSLCVTAPILYCLVRLS